MYQNALQNTIVDSVENRRIKFPSISEKIDSYLLSTEYENPTLIIDLDKVAQSYDALQQGYENGLIYYAIKANPAPEILKMLNAKGSYFDVASRGEIDMCLAQGIAPEKLSFGNTIKKAKDIAYAYEKGICLFAVDAEEEMQKIAYAAPGADVFLRILVENCEADWPLSRKFGCSEESAVALLKLAKSFGLNPRGLSFHVGSQTREPEMWEGIIQKIASVWQDAHDSGIELDLLNIGGGFPATYVKGSQNSLNLNAYTQKVMFFLRKYLHSFPKNIMLEPGRALVANAGLIRAEVVLVSRKRPSDFARWVYLDIGKFSGLAETMDEAIRYPIETPMDHSGEFGPCVLAGPSCDSADVLYEKRPMQLPVDLKAGDEVRILCTGAYTSTYSSVNFNGFKPLETVCL